MKSILKTVDRSVVPFPRVIKNEKDGADSRSRLAGFLSGQGYKQDENLWTFQRKMVHSIHYRSFKYFEPTIVRHKAWIEE